MAALMTGLMIQTAWSGPVFQPPSITSAVNITYPTNVMKPGTVTLQANLDNSGDVQNLDVLRDLPQLTSVASAAVKKLELQTSLVRRPGRAFGPFCQRCFQSLQPRRRGESVPDNLDFPSDSCGHSGIQPVADHGGVLCNLSSG